MKNTKIIKASHRNSTLTEQHFFLTEEETYEEICTTGIKEIPCPVIVENENQALIRERLGQRIAYIRNR